MPDVTNELLPDDAARHGVGGNSPPDPIEILRAQLAETHAPLIERCNTLLAMADRLPETMDDDWEAKISEAIKSCTKFTSNSEVTRLDANRPHRDAIAATDGFFKKLSDKVDALKAKLNKDYLTPYQVAKAAAEKRRREEEARIAKAKADEEARLAREEAARLAEAKRQEAAAKAEAERIERERLEAERRREEEARREAERQVAARREAERQAAEATNRAEREAAFAARAKADREAAEAKAKADFEAAEAKAEADRKAAEAQAAIDRAEEDRREQERIAAEARDRKAAVLQDANVSAKSSRANAADMSRTRTDRGAVSSLRTTWEHEVIAAEDVPREYCVVKDSLIRDAIKAATTDDGKCTLSIPGVRIFPKQSSVVR